MVSKYYLALFMVFVLISTVEAQDRCGTVEYEKIRQQRNPNSETKEQFEQWVKGKIAQRAKALKQGQRTEATTPYIIPVVVHVIHNGEAVGHGTNLSDAQILSQIPVLNADFQRLNADAANTLAEFQPIAGSLNIQFVMAKQDPNGLATNGIVRVKGKQTSWSYSNDVALKATSYWPAENYYNIWVTDLSGGLLGYTQLPISPSGANALQGLEDPDTNRLTDGVVIDYQAYGTADATGGSSFNLLTEYNKGRTVTHETGHFFGLRHIWGDDESSSNTCSGSDYVDDTPNQAVSYNGKCPSTIQTSCSTDNMFQNYMDYTDDACMNLFSQGQADRMTVIIENAVRRVSLLTSAGATAPPAGQNVLDIALNSLTSPSPVSCVSNPAPVITVSNPGNVTITSFQVDVSLNNGTAQSQIVSGISLAAGGEASVTLSAVTLASGTNTLSVALSAPDGSDTETITNNNSATYNLVYNTSTDIIPLRQNFENTFQPAWSMVNVNQQLNWTGPYVNNGTSMEFAAFENTDIGTQAWLVSPTLDLSKNQKASIGFDLSYAKRTTGDDRLQLYASTDCGVTYSEVLYDYSGIELANNYPCGKSSAGIVQTISLNSETAWTLTGTCDWRRDYVDLSTLAGNKNVRLALVATSDGGNNIYIDNIDFYIESYSSANPPDIINQNYLIYYPNSESISSTVYITFNLEDRQDVHLQIYNMQGQVIADNVLPETLNQTYPLDVGQRATGIYIVRLQIGSQYSSTKVYFNN